MSCRDQGTQEFTLKTLKEKTVCVFKKLENSEETTMPRAELSQQVYHFQKCVPFNSQLQGGNNSFTSVFLSLHPKPDVSQTDK